MMDYLVKPIDVLLFDSHFKAAHELDNAIFIAFTQTERRWKATYQDEEMSIRFEGDVTRTLAWLHEREGTT